MQVVKAVLAAPARESLPLSLFEAIALRATFPILHTYPTLALVPHSLTALLCTGRTAPLPSAWGYWKLHVREDERHGRQLVVEVAVSPILRWGAEGGCWSGEAKGERAGRGGFS